MKTQFTEGSVSKHLLTMMFASWVALASGMLLSVADMYFLSRLDDVDVLAAIGFSGSIGMFPLSVGIGFSVSISVLVSQTLGRQGKREASHVFSATLLIALLIASVVAVIILLLLPFLLGLLGAEGRVEELATRYLSLTLLSAPLSVMTMSFAAGLRAGAMAKASMVISVIANIVNIILDPIFIEVLGYGIVGAAWATIVARVISVLVGFWFLAFKLGLIQPISFAEVISVFNKAKTIAMPAVISNLLTPIGGLIVVSIVSGFGSEAMAGLAVVGSISPVLFSVYFSLTGAAGPMVGQNIGAELYARVSDIYRAGIKILALYTLLVWFVLTITFDNIAQLYQLDGLAKELLWLYCFVQIPLSVGLGFIALSNGIFNNLGKSHWAMWLNASRSTVVTFLFCYLGALWFGVFGAVMASTLSFALYGFVCIYLANHLFRAQYPGHRLIF